jgi:uncharacterized tellurite resistance protein B-like protein
MSILQWLRTATNSPSGVPGDTETVRRIVGELDRLDLKEARYLAAFAYVLSRVANADLEISDIESEKMIQLVQRAGRLPEDQAILVIAIAKNQSRLFAGTEDFLVTREFREIATDEQCRELLDCLFAVAAADDRISADEDSQVRQIASELGLTHAEFVLARMAYSDKRSVLRPNDH